MSSGEHVEVAIRAAQIAKTVLELLESHGIQSARLRLAMAAKQFNDLNQLLARIEKSANNKPSGAASAGADGSKVRC